MPLSYEEMEALVQRNQSSPPESRVIIIDVRDPEELIGGYIPGAVNIPRHELRTALALTPEEYIHKYNNKYNTARKPTKEESLIIVYCQRGMRAAQACEVLHNEGYNTADIYSGSWAEWSERQQEKEDKNKQEDKNKEDKNDKSEGSWFGGCHVM